MSKKYLNKNEFRYYKNKDYLSKNNSPHIAYISGKYKHRNNFNIITHSDNFFGEKTMILDENPNRNSDRFVYNKVSRISIPKWDKDTNFSKEKLSGWRFSKSDKKKIKKFNRKFIKNKNQPE